jgi:hypothetical protein
MNTTIKPIETEYAGYRFRSRLEARWAVFMDTLGIKYIYEPDGFDLDGTWYLPDFWLPEQKRWIEIKGQKATEEEKNKARLLALKTEKPAFILAGNIGVRQTGYPFPEYDCRIYFPANRINQFPDSKPMGVWAECKECQQIGLNPLRLDIEWQDLQWLFCQCHKKYRKPDDLIFLWKWTLQNPAEEGNSPNSDIPTGKILEAYRTARSARFEHGETPIR